LVVDVKLARDEFLKVTAIIPVYNHSHLLKKTLLALSYQSYQPDELVISDDGSSEDILSLLQEFLPKFQMKIKYVRQEKNGYRAARCRNNGARVATGECFIFIDQDVILTPNFTQKFIKRIKKNRFCVSYAVRLTGQQTEMIDEAMIKSGDYSSLLTQNQISKLVKQHRKERLYSFLRQLHLRAIGPKFRGGTAVVFKADFLKVNGYDEKFQGWGNEDDNLGRRLYKAGIFGEFPFYDEFPLHLYHLPFHADRVRVNKTYSKQQMKIIRKGIYRCQFGLDNPLDDEALMVMNLN